MKRAKRRMSLFLCMALATSLCFPVKTYKVQAKTSESIVTMDGASIRTTGTQGLRFKITITDFSKAVDYGIEIKNNNKTIVVSLKNGYGKLYSFDNEKDQAEYVAVVTGFQKEQIGREFEATGFVTYADNGNENTVYTDTITRSIQQVADAAGYEFDESISAWVEKKAEQTTTQTETEVEETTEGITEVETTKEGTTVQVTTEVESTEESTTAWVDTEAESTEERTTVQVTTEAESTEERTTAQETTEGETTEEGTTIQTTTELTTEERTTETTTESGNDNEIEELGGYRIASKSEGTSLTLNQDGSLTISFTDDYDAVYLALPEGKTAADYFSVSIDLMSAEQFGFALTDKDGNNLKTSYPAYTVTYDKRDKYVLSFDSLDSDVTAPMTDGCYLRLMTLKNASYGNPANHTPITIYEIKYNERKAPAEQGTTLLEAYKDIFGYVGNAGDLAQLKNTDTLNYYKTEYNSFTLGNEMKPDYILREHGTKTLISTDEAKDSLGYIIPEGYQEEQVPKLYFDVMDETLKIASENGIKMRGHTLVWHQQTPSWFFKEGYSDDGAYVTPEVMNERIKFYITNVMEHVYTGEYKDVIYAWDVVNEYLHQGTSESNSSWVGVYGDEIVQNGKVVTNPSYVKLAFNVTDSILRKYNMRDDVHLFYNDYNTYGVVDECIALIDYLNETDDLNTEGKKLCDGIGMQSHLDVMWPNVTQYLKAVESFANKGYEIQITELDITLNMLGDQNTEEERLVYWQELMEGLIAKKKAGANITAFVVWGLYDDISWRKQYTPLLFSESYYDKKEAYDIVIQAAQTYKDE